MRPRSANERRPTARRRRTGVFAGLALMLLAPVAGADGRGYGEYDAGYRRGDYASATQSTLRYVRAEFGYVAPDYDVSVSIPFLSLREETGTVTTTGSGLGDVVLRAGHVLLPDRGGGSLYGNVGVKLPTADDAKGLGTGETDVGGFLTYSRRLDRVTLMVMGGYVLVGDPRGVDYNNSYQYGLGLMHNTGRGLLYTSVEGRRAIIPGDTNPLELYAGFYHPLGARFTLKGLGFVGLSDGSPDYGLEVGLLRWF
jgi:hypothetical protein